MAEGLPTPAGPRPPSELRILIVDDDRCIRETLSSVLETDGYRVEVAENGQVALDAIRRGSKPDLMLLDLMMPVLSGWEVIEMLEEGDHDLARVPILVISAMSAPVTRGTIGGVRACLTKPIDINVLLDAVRTHATAATQDLSLGASITTPTVEHAHHPRG